METGDPDDFLTLALLAGHPQVNLIAVTVTPGTPHQIGVVRYCLDLFDLDIPVGAFNIDHKKARGTKDEHYVKCVSEWHYRSFGDIPPSTDALVGWEVLRDHLGPDTTLVTGGPLKNTGKLVDETNAHWNKAPGALTQFGLPVDFGQLVIQGGFAGDNIVPPEHRLPKFDGRTTCPTYNLNGDPKAAFKTIGFEGFRDWTRRPYMVSKNVCHGVVYDKVMHERLKAVANPHPGLVQVIKGMEAYLARKPKGKKFHDPLAAMCALNPDIGTWAKVAVVRTKGEWGCLTGQEFYDRPSSEQVNQGSFNDNTVQIITAYDHELFIQTMIGEA